MITTIKDQNYKICTRCVMDTSDEDITFDRQGHCYLCTKLLAEKERAGYRKGVSEQLLESILTNIKAKGKNGKYDCVIGVSGGGDSSYAVHLACSFGLRPLLVHMDNGWNTEIANRNIQHLVETYNLDLETFTLDWEEFKEIQIAFLRSSSVDFEMPTDLAIPYCLYKTAAEHNIKYIISGGNMAGESLLPVTWGYHSRGDMKYYRHIVKNYSRKKIKKIPAVGMFEEFYYKLIKNIRTIYLLNYVDYNKDKAKAFLIENCKWEDYGGKHHESQITAFWHSYIMPTKYNMDYRRATLSSQICSNQTDRESALAILRTPSCDLESGKKMEKQIAEKLGITHEELESYLKLQPRTFKDFPNNKQSIDLLFQTYRRIFKNKRL